MTDDDLLAPLWAELSIHSTVDVRRAMAEGTRRRRRRNWTAGVTAAVIVVLVAVGVSAIKPRPKPQPVTPTGCAVTRLPAGQPRTTVLAGDPSGHYVTGREVGADGSRTVIWKDGKVEARPEAPGVRLSLGPINSSGVAVGSGIVGNQTYGYVYRDGRVTRVPGGQASLTAINDAGVIAGELGRTGEAAPARWSSPGATPMKLSPAGLVTGIGEDGTILGTAGDNEGMLWFPDGTSRVLRLPVQPGQRSRAFQPAAIVGGWVYGVDAAVSSAGWPSSARLRYSIADNRFERMETPGDISGYADNGWAAGRTGPMTPVVVAGPTVVSLPTAGTGPGQYEVRSISHDGHVIAGSVMTAGGETPLIWTCR
jgi:hypothetical protein